MHGGWGMRPGQGSGQGPVTTLQVGLCLACVGGTIPIRAQGFEVYIVTQNNIPDTTRRCEGKGSWPSSLVFWGTAHFKPFPPFKLFMNLEMPCK